MHMPDWLAATALDAHPNIGLYTSLIVVPDYACSILRVV